VVWSRAELVRTIRAFMSHPCLSCGACCAFFRVAFHWLEADPSEGGIVPAGFTVPLDPHRLAMHGTDGNTPRCLSLLGMVGGAASCGIYERRPSPCRDLVPAWESGEPSPQCDRARVAHGLLPLQPQTWVGQPS
jgi:Fe-S-cluster containining protein